MILSLFRTCVISLVLAGPSLIQAANTQPVVASVSSDKDETNSAQIGDILVVEVTNFRDWWEPTDKDAKTPPPRRDPAKLLLYLDGYPVKGVGPIAWPIDAKGAAFLKLPLRRTSDNKETWTALLTREKLATTVSLALPGEVPFETHASIQIIPGNPWVKRWSAIGFGALLVLFGILAKKSSLLRDRDSPWEWYQRPYSLGRCQMALWFFTVLGSFIALWIILKDSDVLPNSVLALIGISSATGLAAAIVDSSKTNQASLARIRELQAEKATQEQKLENVEKKHAKATAPQLTALQTDQTTLKANIAAQEAAISQLADTTMPKSTNLLIDLLSDADGVSFYRFQLFSWTLVLWCIFVIAVVRTLAMPDFSDQMLALMGISGGTYLGFKFPEKK